MRLILVLSLALLWNSGVYADESIQTFWNEPSAPHDFHSKIPGERGQDYNYHGARKKGELSGEELEALANSLSARLRSQYQAVLAEKESEFPGCSKGSDHLKALRLAGDYKACRQWAQKCSRHESSEAVRDLMYQGALCAHSDYDYKAAYELFDRVTSEAAQTDADFAGRVFYFAQFAYSTEFEDQVDSILSRHSNWRVALKTVSGVVERLKKGHSRHATEEQTQAFVEQNTNESQALLREVLVSAWAYSVYRYRNESNRALKYLEKMTPQVSNPESWGVIAYVSFYNQLAPHYKLARKIYEAYLPYAHVRSWLPVERNSYNYSELYSSVCREELLREPRFSDYENLKRQWKRGEISTSEALDEAMQMLDAKKRKADLLAFIAGLYVAQGEDENAIPYYWQAHQACPYYNRSHWGLNNIFRRKRNKAFSDYQKNLEQVEEALKETRYTRRIGSYIVNWPSLSSDSRRRVKYAMRFWAPFVDALYDSGGRVYIKPAYELISEAPGMERMRDRRVNYGTYSKDNRLWDDVRGAGGNVVISDLGETKAAPFGAYNLAAHEVAHQFHALAPRSVQTCISRLYQAAKDRNKFPDPYAGSNEHEYFAQGVVYYLIPQEAPKRFGLNVEWLLEHDRDLYDFLDSFAKVEEISEISCPI